MAETINRLRRVEDAETAYRLNPSGVFGELHRSAQRQFHWQRGYYNLPQLYRYAYLYCQGKCADYFEKRYGLSIADFTFVGFALFASCNSLPYLKRSFSFDDIGLTNDLIRRVLPLVSSPLAQIRKLMVSATQTMNQKHGRPLPTAYLPSILRQLPLIAIDDKQDLFIAPIPELILLRITAGLYYDLIGGGGKLLTEASNRFEQYCADFVAASLPRFKVRRAFRYGTKGEPIDTPDVLIQDAGKLVIVAECKSTKLTYLAQFADDPFDAQQQQYEQLAEGIVQVWRFFSNARRGVVQEEVAPEAYGIILMLDTFLSFSRELRAKVLELAMNISSAEPDILGADRRHVVFCAIQDFESLVGRGNENSLLAALKASSQQQYEGWQLREVHREVTREQNLPRNRYPFRMDAIHPWWRKLQQRIDPSEQVSVDDGD